MLSFFLQQRDNDDEVKTERERVVFFSTKKESVVSKVDFLFSTDSRILLLSPFVSFVS